jgi:hypothetical protein
VISTIPDVNNTFNVGHAATISHDGFVYLLGSFGNGQTAMMTRISVADFKAFSWNQLRYWAEGAVWAPFSDSLQPAALFDFVPSETTLFFHPYLQAWFVSHKWQPMLASCLVKWGGLQLQILPFSRRMCRYVVIANTFMSNFISIRTAATLTGPWSDAIDIYPIPAEMLAGGVFCYAGKAHPELSAPGAAEFIFSFMCNTPTIAELENRTNIYVPQLVRVRILQ